MRTGQAKEQWLFPRGCLLWACFLPAPRKSLCLCSREDGLRMVFLTPQAHCLLRHSQQFYFTQTDDNSVCSLTCVDSWVLTKPKHYYKSISPKETEYRGKAHLLSKAGQLPYNHFRVWFNIHYYPRTWKFWLMLQNLLVYACLGKVLQGMLYFLWWTWCCPSLEALSQSPNSWTSGKHMCLFPFTVKNMSLWLLSWPPWLKRFLSL